MEKDFFKIADQIKQAIRFIQNNAEDMAYQCVKENKFLKNVEIKILADENTHKIIFSYNTVNGNEKQTWFEVEE